MNPDKLFDYLDGRLSPADRTALEEQLMSDAQLRKQFNIAREIHRSSGGTERREVLAESNDPAKAERAGRMGRRVFTAAMVLVFLNVAIGLAVIYGKNRKPKSTARESEIRQQLEASLGAAAQNAMPAPSFVESEMKLTAARSQWDHMADRIVTAASAFGGSAAKGLPDENVMTVLIELPTDREAEFRRALTSAANITPMPLFAPAVKQDGPAGDDKSERTILQVRIAETAQ
jgi:anti-sigma factor RsiW